MQLGEFLGRLLGPLMKFFVPLMKNVLRPLAWSVLIVLLLTALTSTTNVRIYKKYKIRSLCFRNNNTNNIIKDMEEILKRDKSLESSALLLKDITKTIGNEIK